MSNIIEMHSFDKGQRMPTVEKVRRDGMNMCFKSRYVIILDDSGNIIKEIHRKNYMGNYLVVLAPVIYKDTYVPLSVVLEIGFGRAVPYSYFRKREGGKLLTFSFVRRPVAKLTDEKLISLFPQIGEAIQKVTDETVSNWENSVWKNRYKDATYLLMASTITIPYEEKSLCYVCLEKALLGREKSHIAMFVSLVKIRLSKLKYANYTDKEIKRFKVVQEIAYVLHEAQYPSHFLEIIRKKMGSMATKNRVLFEQIIEVFKIKPTEGNRDDEFHFALREKYGEKNHIINKFSPSVRTNPKKDAKRKSHTKSGNFLRVEIEVSKDIVQKKHPNLTI